MKKLKSVKWINDRLERCGCDAGFLSDYRKTESSITDLIQKSGLSVVEKSFHQFDRGYTCVWLFKQSHLSLHSWPEYNFVTMSIEVCHFEDDDEKVIEKLYRELVEFFKPASTDPTKRTILLAP